MPKYEVDLGREINPDHGLVVVEASDEEDARQVALDMARAGDKAIEWTDGDQPINTYVTDVTLVDSDTPVSTGFPEHIWEYTVQKNGDWHWTRSRGPIDFREAVVEALDYESSVEGGRLVSIANVDPPQI